MKLSMYSVHDSKAGVFAAPFCARSRGEAIRSFQIACGDDQLPFKKFPGDYTLFLLAEFDDNTGLIVPQSSPDRVIGAGEF